MEFFATEDKVKVLGRSLFVDNVRYLSFSGSSISFSFIGTKATATLYSDASSWDATLKGFMTVYVNDESEPRQRFELQDGEHEYVLYESQTKEAVTLRLERVTEAAFAKCGVKKLWVDADALLPKPLEKEHKIEIIGDSITCGYGVEAESELITFHTAQENPRKSYSLLTAKALDVDVHLVSWSGIGVISRYVEPEINEPLNDWLMPMLYQYTDAHVSQEILKQDKKDWEKWDFRKFVPELIVVNLGTNDASYCREHEDRQAHYAREYEQFLRFIRSNNPDAQILCVLGTMDQRLCATLEQCVNAYKKSAEDENVTYLHLPEQLEEDGKGADYHPSFVTQQKTAALVTAKIREIMNW